MAHVEYAVLDEDGQVWPTPGEEDARRLARRAGGTVLTRHVSDWAPPERLSPAPGTPTEGTPMHRPTAVIIDIDGTLTIRRFGGPSPATYRPAIWDPEARTPYDWDRVGEDLPNPPMIEVARALHAAGHLIVVTSGRSEACRAQTEAWLTGHGIPWHVLHMASLAETERGVPDWQVKERIWRTEIEPTYQILMSFDDRQEVVDLWRSAGLVCAQVAPGDF